MPLNKEQLQAVNSKSDRILCLAAAGSGKTATLVNRVSKLVENGVDPHSILSLTFTNAAGAEMRERYEKQNPGGAIPEFRTFHSFCYSIVCNDPAIREALGYSDIPNIASEAQERSIAEKAKTQCNITLSKEQLTSPNGLTKKEQFQVDLYNKAITRLMRAENLITFDKLNSDVAELFASGHPATQYYKDRYKYILTDEYQDTDSYQMKFLNSFPDSNFYLTGDTLQNIYSFRGTSNEYIKMLANAPDWEKIRLFTNYRSTNQICAYANAFSKKYADESYWIEMKGTRDGEKVKTKYVEPPAKYSAIHPDSIKDVMQELENLSGTSAILCRTNREVSAVSNYLRDYGIEFNSGKDTVTPQLVACALSDTYMVDWLALYLPNNKYGEYIKLSTQVKNPDLAWFLRLYGRNAQIKDDVAIITQLKDIAAMPKSIKDKIDAVQDLLGIDNLKVPDTEYSGADFLRYLKDSIDHRNTSALYVGTIHSVKGLEYDNVFVMNVGSYNFQLNTEEMKNLFYVAITRAKNRLYVYKLFE